MIFPKNEMAGIEMQVRGGGRKAAGKSEAGGCEPAPYTLLILFKISRN